MFYFVKNPFWLQKIFPKCIWNIRSERKIIYLTFDDGPQPEVTQFVLEELKKYNAKATFFCIGNNVLNHPYLFQNILDEGHAVGNHTFQHLDGWKIKDQDYYADVQKAALVISSKFFRPPYGHITPAQITNLKRQGFEVVMWSIISGDFDQKISPEKCFSNVAVNIHPGAIIVFHDSLKAFKNMRYVLPRILETCTKQGYSFESLSGKVLL